MEQTRNLRVVKVGGAKHSTWQTLATLEALYAYAMWVEVTLTFNNTTATITSNDEGMFDLNDIWRVFRLENTHRPSQWRDKKVRKHLEETANLHVLRKTASGTIGWQTLATLEALYAYAM